MKQFFKWLGKHIAGALVFSLFSILFIAGLVYALTYPSAPPVGEVAGGKFMQYFNSIKVACPAGQYLNGYDANYNKICVAVPAGAPGKDGLPGNTGIAAAVGAINASGILWDGTERCISQNIADNGAIGGFNTKSCIRITSNIVQTKIDFSVWHPNTGTRTATSGWVNGDSEAKLSSMPGLDPATYGCKVFSRWANPVPPSAPFCGANGFGGNYVATGIGSPVVW